MIQDFDISGATISVREIGIEIIGINGLSFKKYKNHNPKYAGANKVNLLKGSFMIGTTGNSRLRLMGYQQASGNL